MANEADGKANGTSTGPIARARWLKVERSLKSEQAIELRWVCAYTYPVASVTWCMSQHVTRRRVSEKSESI